jgi:filamentous hemagglutinin family protein
VKSILNKGFVGFLIVTLVFYLSPAPYAYANPVGGDVSSGQATITTSGKTETIDQTTSKAVIDWTGFNINSGETTKFVQPNSSSLTVNRVHDMNPSQIFGSLTANGNLVLINPNGVFFGPGSKIDVNGIVVTTSNVANSNVMSGGTMNFTPGGNVNASVVNAGSITAADAGLVGLVAPNVQNSGVITARLGKVQLASGDSFNLDFYGDNLLKIGVSDAVGQQMVQNLGTINADGGTVKLTAAAGRSIVNSLIDVEGQINTPAFKEQNGEIEIFAAGSNAVPGNVAANKGLKTGSSTVTISGDLDASGYGAGQTGGNISVLGDNVGIMSGALLDVSGDQGGGNIKIGGDFHGAGTTPTALNVYVDPNSLIGASAITKGNGGNVAVWSDDYTNFLGLITARGGPNGGNGGFVETSGHQTLNMQGSVDASAPKGKAGTWLMDPEDVTISTGTDSDETGNPNFVPGGTQATAVINTTDIDNALNAGTNVTVTTTGSGAAGSQSGPNGGSITVSNPISATGNGTALTTTGSLTLSSYQDIIVNAAITLGGGTNTSSATVKGGALTLQSANSGNGIGAIDVGANISTNGGAITMGGGSGAISAGSGYATGDSYQAIGIYNTATVNAGGGSIIANGYGGTNSAGGNYGINGGTYETTGSGTITLYGTGGNGGNLNDAGVNSGAIQTVNGNIIINATAASVGTGGGDQGDTKSNLTASGTGNITVTGYGGGASTGGATFNSGIYNDTISSNSGSITLTGTGGNGNYSAGIRPADGGAGAHITSTSGAISITGTDGPNGYAGVYIARGGSITTGGSITITAITDGILTDSGYTTTIGNSSTTGNITLNADSLSFGGTTNITTTGTVTIAPYSSTTTIGVAGGTGTLQITSGILGSITAGNLVIGSGNLNVGVANLIDVDAYTWNKNVEFSDRNGIIIIDGAQTVNSGYNMTFSSNEAPTLNATIAGSSTGTILFEPCNFGDSVGVAGGAGNSQNISTAILGNISGFGTYAFTTGGGGINVNAYNWGTANLVLTDTTGPITMAAGATTLKNLSIQTDANPVISSTITGSGVLSILPTTASTTMEIGGSTKTIDITNAELTNLGTGWTGITFGSAAMTGAMQVDAETWSNPVTFNNGSGKIEFSGAQSLGANSLTAVSNSGNIQLDSGATITSTASSGPSIILAAGGNFVNNSGGGSSTLNAGSGTATWRVYSTSPGSDTNGASVLNPATTVYSTTYPTSTGASGNTWFYSVGTTPENITLTATAQTVTYGTNPNAPTYNTTYTCTAGACGDLAGGSGGTFTISGGSGTSGTSGFYNAGTHTITLSGVTPTWDSGYSSGTITYGTGTLTVNSKPITVTAATNSRTYDGGVDAAATGSITSGSLLAGDTATWTEVYTNKNVGSGNKPLTASGDVVNDGNGGNNYAVTFVSNTTGTITPYAITVTAATNSRTYDGGVDATALGSITSGSLQGTDTATWTEVYTNKNVGAGNKTLTASADVVNDGNSGNNYTVTFVNTTTGTINPEAITITAASNTKTYDGTTTAAATPTVTSGSIMAGDTADFTETYASKNAGTGLTLTPAGSVTDGNSGNNYTVTFTNNTTGIINPEAITVTAATNTKTYDGTTTAAATPTVTSGSIMTGDTGNFTETYASPTTGTGLTLTPAGTVSDGNSGNNYQIAFVNNTTGVINAVASSGGGGGGTVLSPPVVTPPVVTTPAPAPTPVVMPAPTPSVIPETVQQVVVNTPGIWNSDTVVNDPNNVGISFVNQPTFAASDVDVQAPVINAPVVPAASPSNSEAIAPLNPVSGDSTTTQPSTSNNGVVQQPNPSGDVSTDQKKKDEDKKAKARQQSRRELRERLARTGRLWRLRLQDAEAHELQPSS